MWHRAKLSVSTALAIVTLLPHLRSLYLESLELQGRETDSNSSTSNFLPNALPLETLSFWSVRLDANQALADLLNTFSSIGALKCGGLWVNRPNSDPIPTLLQPVTVRSLTLPDSGYALPVITTMLRGVSSLGELESLHVSYDIDLDIQPVNLLLEEVHSSLTKFTYNLDEDIDFDEPIPVAILSKCSVLRSAHFHMPCTNTGFPEEYAQVLEAIYDTLSTAPSPHEVEFHFKVHSKSTRNDLSICLPECDWRRMDVLMRKWARLERVVFRFVLGAKLEAEAGEVAELVDIITEGLPETQSHNKLDIQVTNGGDS